MEIKSQAVSIIFHDESINRLFSALLSSMHIENRILHNSGEIFGSDVLITERKFYNLVKDVQNMRCLVVGDPLPVNLNAITLERPLTEQKVVAALNYLLAGPDYQA
jgi:hypothetical protein